jgi:phosphonate transport system substrate-binding protein
MRFRTKTIAALAAGVVALTTLAACSSGATDAAATKSADPNAGTFASGDSKTLIFATVPDKAGTDSSWKPLEDYIAKKTGLTVQFKPTTDYAALIAAGIAGQVDVGSFSGATYTLAEKKGAKFDLVSAVGVEAGASTPGYYSEAIVPASSSISKVADFKGKTICFVSPQSTSGFFFPLHTLKAAGISVDSTGNDANGNPQFKDFTAYFAGAHDKSVAAVESGQCQVGFAEDTEADAAKDLKVIDKELVPGGPLVISSALPQSVKDKLTAALSDVTLDDITKSGVTVTDAFKSGFQFAKKVDGKFYDQIADICATIPAAGCAS